VTALFTTIVADPAWRTKSGRMTGRKGFADSYNGANRKLPYPTMAFRDICALPVRDLAADNAHLYLWIINKYLLRAREVIDAWGFEYSTTLVWAKNAMGGGLGEPFGITTEYLIHAKRGTLKCTNRVTGTWFNWKRPYEDGHPHHSAKPPESYALVEHVSPGPYVELFSRADQPRLGWSYWGNESLGTAKLHA
jgi:N6-adenosine-specific RNA methylase IME4